MESTGNLEFDVFLILFICIFSGTVMLLIAWSILGANGKSGKSAGATGSLDASEM